MSRMPNSLPYGRDEASDTDGQPPLPEPSSPSDDAASAHNINIETKWLDRVAAWHDKYNEEAFSTAYLVLRNRQDADDCVQEVFVHLCRLATQRVDEPRAFILRCVKNRARNMRRVRLGRPGRPHQFPTAGRDDSATPGAYLFADERISKLIDSLSELGKQVDYPSLFNSSIEAVTNLQDRVILCLRHPFLIQESEQWSWERIGRLLGVSDGTVRRRYAEVLLALRDHIENHLRQQGLER